MLDNENKRLTMSTGIRVLLTSDIHLGVPEERAIIPWDARIETFKKIASIAAEHDILLVAGDLIDSPSSGHAISGIIHDTFSGLIDAGKAIVLTPGDGETGGDASGLERIFDLLPLTHMFTQKNMTEPFIFSLENENLLIYGAPAGTPDISIILKKNIPGLHMGLFHVIFDEGNTSDSACRFGKREIKNLGLDFYACGHCHNFKLIKSGDKIIGAYPGSPEACSHAEKGDRYVISMNVINGSVQNMRRITVNTMNVAEWSGDVTGSKDPMTTFSALAKMGSKRTILRCILNGKRDFILPAVPGQISSLFYKIDIQDNTEPTIEALLKEFGKEDTLRGEFIRMIKERMDTNAIPSDIREDCISRTANALIRRGFESPEDWLCV
jgi:DNA repair exonuclease SbcCD nuclease subunit